MRPIVETLAIGDEILCGKITDSNSTFVADQLFQSGLRLCRESVIADSPTEITTTLEALAQRADVVIVFGGLGPTTDDRTVECVARWLGTPVIKDIESEKRLIKRYEEHGRTVNSISLKQTLYPQVCMPYLNQVGMAPGFGCVVQGCHFHFLPGVPSEMKQMFTDTVLPSILRATREGSSGKLFHRTWRCLGIPEADLQHQLVSIEEKLPPHCYLGYRTNFPENHVTLYVKQEKEKGDGAISDLEQCIGKVLGPWCYTDQDRNLEQLVVDDLLRQRWSVALVESCTGGLVVQRLTRIAGSSKCVWGGFVTYQTDAKKRMLNVALDHEEVAVGRNCTLRLAQQAKITSGCSIAAAITGYMGPTGGTMVDPIGTIYMAVVTDAVSEKRIELTRLDRESLQWGASTHLLHLLFERLPRNC